MYPKLKICIKICDYKFDRSDIFYSLKALVTGADMAVLSISFGEWKSEKNWVLRKKSEMFVASGLRGYDFSLLFSIGEVTPKCTGHLPSAREMWTHKGGEGTGTSHP